MTIEIVSFPINSMVIFHCFFYVYQRVIQPENHGRSMMKIAAPTPHSFSRPANLEGPLHLQRAQPVWFFFGFFSVSKVPCDGWFGWWKQVLCFEFFIRIVEKHRTSAYQQKPSQHPSCLPFIISTYLNHPTLKNSLRPDVLHQVGNRGVVKHQGGR